MNVAFRNPLLGNLVLLCVVSLLSADMWLYWHRVNDPTHASAPSSSFLKPRVLTDLYPSWYGSRELLLHHRDPYGAEVSRELQIAYYGKELDASRPEERRDQQRFAYPLYFVFFMAPLVWMPFHAVRIVFWWVLAVCAAVNLLFWTRVVRVRLSMLSLVALFLMFLCSIPVCQNLGILQPFLLPACLIAGAAAAVVSKRFFVSGALLAAATIKPQICLLPIAWFALWVGSDWKHRRNLFFGFGATLAPLVIASECLLPGWLKRYPEVLRSYAEYTRASSFLGTLLPSALNWMVTLLVLAWVTNVCWRARRQPSDSEAFAVALSSVLTITVLIIPAVVQPFNHVLLLPALLLVIRHWQKLRQGTPLTRTASSAFCLIVFVPWLLAAVAVGNPVVPHRDWMLKVWFLPLAAAMALPFAVFGMLILVQKVIGTRGISSALNGRT